MIRGLYEAASGLGILQARMDATSNNLANASTTGFKQDRVEVAAFPDLLLQEKTRFNVNGVDLGGWSPVGYTNQGAAVTGVYTDHSAGILKATGRGTDIALSGEGFFSFQVPGEQGENNVFYSRDGELHRDSEGYLVDSRENKILGEDGPVKVGDGDFTVSPDGTVTTADNQQVKLKIVDFPDRQKLVKEGNNYFSDPSGEAVAANNPGVTQKHLESSNVDVTSETVNLIEIMRAYEASQKLIQNEDELAGMAINQVGTVNK